MQNLTGDPTSKGKGKMLSPLENAQKDRKLDSIEMSHYPESRNHHDCVSPKEINRFQLIPHIACAFEKKELKNIFQTFSRRLSESVLCNLKVIYPCEIICANLPTI